MTENKTETRPHTISVDHYARREAAKEAAPYLSDRILYGREKSAAADRIRDQVGMQIMAGTLQAYEFIGGTPQPVTVDAPNRHRLIVQLAAWLDGRRSRPAIRAIPGSWGVTESETANGEWTGYLYIEDVDIAAELAAAKARIAELEAELAKGGNDLPDNERKKLLKIVLGMAMGAYGYDPENKRNEATGKGAQSISAGLQQYGLGTDPDAIKEYLEEAAAIHYDKTKDPRKQRKA